MKNKNLLYLIFGFMLLIRFTDVTVFNWLFNQSIPDWFKQVYSVVVYTLIFGVILLYRDHLNKINVDKQYIYLFLITGGILFIWYLPLAAGLYILLLVATIYEFDKKKLLRHKNNHVNLSQLVTYLLIPLIPLILIVMGYISDGKELAIENQSFLNRILQANPSGVIFEEILFRGVLWMVLIELKMDQNKVVYVQGAAFWLAHYNIFLDHNYYSFFITLPCVALYWGYLVKKHNSISLTALCHFVFNLAVGYFKSWI